MTQPILIELIDSEQAFDALEPDWQRLSSANPMSSLFSGWAWNRSWWTHYCGLGELHLVVLRREGVVCAIAPLYRTRLRLLRVFETDALRFLGTGGDTSPDDLDVLLEPGEPVETINALCEFLLTKVDVTRLHWTDLTEESRFVQRFIHIVERKKGFLRRMEPVARLVQPLPQTFEEYRKSLSRNARKHAKRRHNRLRAAGVAKYEFCTSHDEVDSVLDALVELHRARHLSKGNEYSFASEAYRSFHRELMHTLLDRDELRLLSLTLNGQIIGVEYAFEAAGALCFFQTGFDPEFDFLSPGHLMMAYMIENAIERGVASIDLLKGTYPYKARYARVVRNSCQIDYCKPGVHALLSRIAEFARMRLLASGMRALKP